MRRYLCFLTLLAAIFLACTANSKNLYVFDLEAYFKAQPERSVAWRSDVLRLVSGLQGLVNRPVAPVESGRSVPDTLLYVVFLHEGISGHQMNLDKYWLQYLRYPGRLLADYDLVEVESLEALLTATDIAEHYDGVVLWDERVPASANVAMTVCGVLGQLPVRRDVRPEANSLHQQIVDSGPQLEVMQTLVGKFRGTGQIPDTSKHTPTTESRKCDAYVWAIEQFLETQLCSDQYLAYYLDGIDWDPETPEWQCDDLANSGVLNMDFYVSEKAFFFDLDPWWSEIAPDDLFLAQRHNHPFPHQGTDELILKQILQTVYRNHSGQKFSSIGGFVPWFAKYTTTAPYYKGMQTPEETEWEFLSIVSAYNCYVEGDAYALGGMANASIFRHVRLADRYEQNLIPSRETVEKRLGGDTKNHTYLLLYMGDYDSPAWLSHAIPTIWDDSYRGRLDLTWGVNPSVSERGSQMFEYLYNTRTDRDYFVGGSSGAGYIHPAFLFQDRKHSPFKSADWNWWLFNRKWYRKFDYQITGLVINGLGGDLDQKTQEMFFNFSPHGVVTQNKFFQSLSKKLVPFIQIAGDLTHFDTEPSDIAKRIAEQPVNGFPDFQVWRCFQSTPANLYFAIRELQEKYPDRHYEVVDPYTFFYLLREHLGGDNHYIGLVYDHDIPKLMETSVQYHCHVLLRNDGWDAWNPVGINVNQRYRLAYHWIRDADGQVVPNSTAAYVIPGPVLTGEKVEIQTLVGAPAEPGLYRLRLYIEQEDRTPEGPARSKLYEDVYISVSEPNR